MTDEEVIFESLYLCSSRNGVYKSKEFRGYGIKMVNMGELFGYDFIHNQEMEKIRSMVDLGGSVGGVAQILVFSVIVFFVVSLALLCFCGMILIFIKVGRYLIVHINEAMRESPQLILAKKISFPSIPESTTRSPMPAGEGTKRG
jgi:hypothetical protein